MKSNAKGNGEIILKNSDKMAHFKTEIFPKTRIATNGVCSVGLQKYHIAILMIDELQIREMLNMTVLLDHDVVDGAEMARFISKLSYNIEKGKEL